MNPPETLFGDGDMEYLKINQVYWVDSLSVLVVGLEDDKFLLLLFRRSGGNKYLIVKNIVNIMAGRGINSNGTLPPIRRSIQEFMNKVIKQYNGTMDILAERWLKKNKEKG